MENQQAKVYVATFETKALQIRGPNEVAATLTRCRSGIAYTLRSLVDGWEVDSGAKGGKRIGHGGEYRQWLRSSAIRNSRHACLGSVVKACATGLRVANGGQEADSQRFRYEDRRAEAPWPQPGNAVKSMGHPAFRM